jgi:hypothetical protein
MQNGRIVLVASSFRYGAARTAVSHAGLSAAGSPTRVSLRIQDTGLDPAASAGLSP